MIRSILIGVLVVGIFGGVCAETFPLSLKNLSLEEAQILPGGYGGYGQVTLRQPAGVRKLPKIVSSKPIYAEVQQMGPQPNTTAKTLVLLLDESQGDRKGYDRLIADLNMNGDLTDDPVFEALQGGNQRMVNADFEQRAFGPIEAPNSLEVGQWRPRFYVDLYLYNKRAIHSSNLGSGLNYFGQVRTLVGNILETTVNVNGVRQKFGVSDGNCNFNLGEAAQMVKVGGSSPRTTRWYLSAADYFLRDFDNNGKFERQSLEGDAEAFSSLVYFGAKPYMAALADDLRSISFEAYGGPLGELQLKPTLTHLVLGWEKSLGRWEVLTPGIKDGKARMPVGKYRISTCIVGSKAVNGTVVAAQSNEFPDQDLTVGANEAAVFKYGTPLTMSVTAKKDTLSGAQQAGALGAIRSLFGGTSSAKQQLALQMNVEIKGAGGEKYSGFIQEGNRGYASPPQFEVFAAGDKLVASGNFEYG